MWWSLEFLPFDDLSTRTSSARSRLSREVPTPEAASAWTLTSSLQALGPVERGDVIGVALDQGDYLMQVYFY